MYAYRYLKRRAEKVRSERNTAQQNATVSAGRVSDRVSAVSAMVSAQVSTETRFALVRFAAWFARIGTTHRPTTQHTTHGMDTSHIVTSQGTSHGMSGTQGTGTQAGTQGMRG